MRERRMPTLADAQRQVWVRELLGWLFGAPALIFLLLFLGDENETCKIPDRPPLTHCKCR
jgi:hypothetical protein